jgi:hypothetical protein
MRTYVRSSDLNHIISKKKFLSKIIQQSIPCLSHSLPSFSKLDSTMHGKWMMHSQFAHELAPLRSRTQTSEIPIPLIFVF